MSSQGYGFSSGHVWMWELDCEESWALKNWCFWTVVLEKTLESPLDCKEIQPVHSEGDEPWDFFGRNDAKAEAPVLWPPHAKSWLIGKDSDARKDWGQEEKGTTEDEMAGWHHGLDGHESECTPGVHPNSCPLSQWCHPAISSSAFPFSSWPQSLPASESFPMSQLFAWGGQSTGASALASFLPKKSQGWSPSEWAGWISLQTKGLESSPTPQFKSINSSALSLLHSPTLTSIHDHRKNHSLD